MVSSAGKTLLFLGIVVSISLLAGMACSPNLWLVERSFPLVPLLTDSPFLSAWQHLAFLVTGFVALMLMLVRPHGIFVLVFLMSFGTVILQDAMRLQPWVYLYLLCLSVIGTGLAWRSHWNALNTLRLIVVCLYFYAGLFKINDAFFQYAGITYLSFLNPLLPESLSGLPPLLGYALPFIEMGIGIGLLTLRFRGAAVRMALLMHLFILVFVVLRLNWNFVIVPWNLGMMAMVILLFRSNGHSSIGHILFNERWPLHILVTMLVAIMPMNHFIGFWDTYPSFDLYSYRGQSVLIVWGEGDRHRFMNAYGLDEHALPGTHTEMRLDDWAYSALNVPIYPEHRVLRKLVDGLHDNGVLNNSTVYVGPVYREKEAGSLMY